MALCKREEQIARIIYDSFIPRIKTEEGLNYQCIIINYISEMELFFPVIELVRLVKDDKVNIYLKSEAIKRCSRHSEGDEYKAVYCQDWYKCVCSDCDECNSWADGEWDDDNLDNNTIMASTELIPIDGITVEELIKLVTTLSERIEMVKYCINCETYVYRSYQLDSKGVCLSCRLNGCTIGEDSDEEEESEISDDEKLASSDEE